MKQKDEWAYSFVRRILLPRATDSNQKLAHKSWLAGFDFAKKEAAEMVDRCEGSTFGIENIGEDRLPNPKRGL